MIKKAGGWNSDLDRKKTLQVKLLFCISLRTNTNIYWASADPFYFFVSISISHSQWTHSSSSLEQRGKFANVECLSLGHQLKLPLAMRQLEFHLPTSFPIPFLNQHSSCFYYPGHKEDLAICHALDKNLKSNYIFRTRESLQCAWVNLDTKWFITYNVL